MYAITILLFLLWGCYPPETPLSGNFCSDIEELGKKEYSCQQSYQLAYTYSFYQETFNEKRPQLLMKKISANVKNADQREFGAYESSECLFEVVFKQFTPTSFDFEVCVVNNSSNPVLISAFDLDFYDFLGTYKFSVSYEDDPSGVEDDPLEGEPFTVAPTEKKCSLFEHPIADLMAKAYTNGSASTCTFLTGCFYESIVRSKFRSVAVNQLPSSLSDK